MTELIFPLATGGSDPAMLVMSDIIGILSLSEGIYSCLAFYFYSYEFGAEVRGQQEEGGRI